jgi:hypothetical protein
LPSCAFDGLQFRFSRFPCLIHAGSHFEDSTFSQSIFRLTPLTPPSHQRFISGSNVPSQEDQAVVFPGFRRRVSTPRWPSFGTSQPHFSYSPLHCSPRRHASIPTAAPSLRSQSPLAIRPPPTQPCAARSTGPACLTFSAPSLTRDCSAATAAPTASGARRPARAFVPRVRDTV